MVQATFAAVDYVPPYLDRPDVPPFTATHPNAIGLLYRADILANRPTMVDDHQTYTRQIAALRKRRQNNELSEDEFERERETLAGKLFDDDLRRHNIAAAMAANTDAIVTDPPRPRYENVSEGRRQRSHSSKQAQCARYAN